MTSVTVEAVDADACNNNPDHALRDAKSVIAPPRSGRTRRCSRACARSSATPRAHRQHVAGSTVQRNDGRSLRDAAPLVHQRVRSKVVGSRASRPSGLARRRLPRQCLHRCWKPFDARAHPFGFRCRNTTRPSSRRSRPTARKKQQMLMASVRSPRRALGVVPHASPPDQVSCFQSAPCLDSVDAVAPATERVVAVGADTATHHSPITGQTPHDE